MKKIHFFKAKSRLGMINIPYRGTSLNIGVENGSDTILSEEFLNSLNRDYKVSEFDFSLPENINKEDYFKILAEESKKFAEFIKKNLANDEIQVVIGGDHSISFGSVLNTAFKYRHVGFGIIQIDSHADLHLAKTSPSGNFHGMYLRPFFDKFDNKNIAALTDNCKLTTENLLYIGNLEIEPEEEKFIVDNNIQVLNNNLFENNLISTILLLKSFINKFNHIHISFDVDVLDSNIVKATGTPATNGFNLELITDILRIVKKEALSYSFDLVEVNPAKAGNKETVEVARQLLKIIINS